jgi:hypothetical protein
MLRRTMAFVALALLGCGDSTGPSGLNGTVTFTFTGAGGGTFTVTGSAPQGSEPPLNANMTAASQDVEGNQTVVIAFKSTGGENGDVLIIGINRTTVGSDPIAEDCDPEATACSGLVFFPNFNGESLLWACALLDGTVAITEVTSSRVKGTFSGTGECYDEGTDDLEPFTITNGTFNVAMTADVLAGNRQIGTTSMLRRDR